MTESNEEPLVMRGGGRQWHGGKGGTFSSKAT